MVWTCFFAQLGAIGFVGPDEPRYAEVAREMAQGGDWVTPRLYGEPWFEKPILYYWAAAAGFKFSLGDEVAARLPSALAALLALLSVFWAAWRFYGNETAWTTALIFPTCIGTLAFAHAATPDMIFTASLACAMASAGEVLRRAGSLRGRCPSAHAAGDHAPLLLFGAWLGCGTLAKGPAALVLAGGAIALWALATQRWRAAFRLAHPLVMGTFSLIALPWFVLCALRNPGFLRTFLFLHNFERYLTPVFKHVQPFWFFGLVLLLGLLPWTVLLGGTVRRVAQRGRIWRESPGMFFACWAVFPVIFFSFSRSKLPGYVLPAFPALALLMARGIADGDAKSDRLNRWLLAAVEGTWLALLGLPISRWAGHLPQEARAEFVRHVLAWGAVAVAGGVLILTLALARKARDAILVSALLLAGIVEVANLRFLPDLDRYISARPAAKALVSSPELRGNVYAFRLQRGIHYGLNFYFSRELPDWSKSVRGPVWVCTTAEGVKELEQAGVSIRFLNPISPGILLARMESSQP
jgi:4-amino-4-deoxy-L-arabinose transferase-like glycosyltransferase